MRPIVGVLFVLGSVALSTIHISGAFITLMIIAALYSALDDTIKQLDELIRKGK